MLLHYPELPQKLLKLCLNFTEYFTEEKYLQEGNQYTLKLYIKELDNLIKEFSSDRPLIAFFQESDLIESFSFVLQDFINQVNNGVKVMLKQAEVIYQAFQEDLEVDVEGLSELHKSTLYQSAQKVSVQHENRENELVDYAQILEFFDEFREQVEESRKEYNALEVNKQEVLDYATKSVKKWRLHLQHLQDAQNNADHQHKCILNNSSFIRNKSSNQSGGSTPGTPPNQRLSHIERLSDELQELMRLLATRLALRSQCEPVQNKINEAVQAFCDFKNNPFNELLLEWSGSFVFVFRNYRNLLRQMKRAVRSCQLSCSSQASSSSNSLSGHSLQQKQQQNKINILKKHSSPMKSDSTHEQSTPFTGRSVNGVNSEEHLTPCAATVLSSNVGSTKGRQLPFGFGMSQHKVTADAALLQLRQNTPRTNNNQQDQEINKENAVVFNQLERRSGEALSQKWNNGAIEEGKVKNQVEQVSSSKHQENESNTFEREMRRLKRKTLICRSKAKTYDQGLTSTMANFTSIQKQNKRNQPAVTQAQVQLSEAIDINASSPAENESFVLSEVPPELNQQDGNTQLSEEKSCLTCNIF